MNRLASFLMRFIKWTIFVMSLAAIVHIAVVLYLPSFAMSRLNAKLIEAGGNNVALPSPRPDADARGVVMPSPDLLYSICAYDVRETPLRITSPVPNSYWSLSVYADNTENFLVINDAQAGGLEVDLILVGQDQEVDNPERLPLIDAETPTGVVLMRSLITSEDDLAYLDALRRQARCAPYTVPDAVDLPAPTEKPDEPTLEGDAP